jgi:hypothetical protein
LTKSKIVFNFFETCKYNFKILNIEESPELMYQRNFSTL